MVCTKCGLYSIRQEKKAKAETEALFRYIRKMTFNVGGIWQSEGGKDETRRALVVAEAQGGSTGGSVNSNRNDRSAISMNSVVADYSTTGNLKEATRARLQQDSQDLQDLQDPGGVLNPDSAIGRGIDLLVSQGQEEGKVGGETGTAAKTEAEAETETETERALADFSTKIKLLERAVAEGALDNGNGNGNGGVWLNDLNSVKRSLEEAEDAQSGENEKTRGSSSGRDSGRDSGEGEGEGKGGNRNRNRGVLDVGDMSWNNPKVNNPKVVIVIPEPLPGYEENIRLLVQQEEEEKEKEKEMVEEGISIRTRKNRSNEDIDNNNDNNNDNENNNDNDDDDDNREKLLEMGWVEDLPNPELIDELRMREAEQEKEQQDKYKDKDKDKDMSFSLVDTNNSNNSNNSQESKESRAVGVLKSKRGYMLKEVENDRARDAMRMSTIEERLCGAYEEMDVLLKKKQQNDKKIQNVRSLLNTKKEKDKEKEKESK